MSSEAVAAPGAHRETAQGSVASRLVRYFKAQVEDWYDECRHLAKWERDHLVDDCPPASLAQHAQLLDELEQVGNWLAQATRSPDFPDRPTAELVSMALQDLQDARSMWHGSTLSGQQRADILKACFHES
jgi:hypothetical protein